ncbi:hypothetical protein BKA81DRAFT_361540 [Phyllosticta paracitricarpa]
MSNLPRTRESTPSSAGGARSCRPSPPSRTYCPLPVTTASQRLSQRVDRFTAGALPRSASLAKPVNRSLQRNKTRRGPVGEDVARVMFANWGHGKSRCGPELERKKSSKAKRRSTDVVVVDVQGLTRLAVERCPRPCSGATNARFAESALAPSVGSKHQDEWRLNWCLGVCTPDVTTRCYQHP